MRVVDDAERHDTGFPHGPTRRDALATELECEP
jgi:hypothetical protein